MIQRVQSIYLALATIVISILLFSPVGIFTDSSANIYNLSFKGFSQFVNYGWLVKYKCYLMDSIILLTLATSVISIFYFKNRKEQIRICWLQIILNLLILLSFYYEINIAKVHFLLSCSSLYITTILPVIAIILVYLAMKAIKKDENLVRSMDRIR
jgi:hypothetical protein